MREPTKNWLMCSECEYIFQSEDLPETCPSCQKKCAFVNVSCYVPECGGPDNLDVRLVAARSKADKKSPE